MTATPSAPAAITSPALAAVMPAMAQMGKSALRARTVERHGPWVPGDASWYPWVSRALFRYGLERPTREVVEEFLGGPVTPGALLKDMARMKS